MTLNFNLFSVIIRSINNTLRALQFQLLAFQIDFVAQFKFGNRFFDKLCEQSTCLLFKSCFCSVNSKCKLLLDLVIQSLLKCWSKLLNKHSCFVTPFKTNPQTPCLI